MIVAQAVVTLKNGGPSQPPLRGAGTPPSTVLHFVKKLRKRAQSIGLFISMSGYASGAVQEVKELTGEVPTVLFGPQDIEALFKGVIRLDDLLNATTGQPLLVAVRPRLHVR